MVARRGTHTEGIKESPMAAMRAHIAATRTTHMVVTVGKVRKGVPMAMDNKITMAQWPLGGNMGLRVVGTVEGRRMRKRRVVRSKREQDWCCNPQREL